MKAWACLALLLAVASCVHARRELNQVAGARWWVYAMPNTVVKGNQLLAYNGNANALKFCNSKGFPAVAKAVSQPFAAAIWRDGTYDSTTGASCSQQASGCPGYLYIMCAKAGVKASAAEDKRGNIGFKNTGRGNIGNYNAGSGNLGDNNGGDSNVGNSHAVGSNGNTGFANVGSGNTGNQNVGQGNSGNGNVGQGNQGNQNQGQGNTGAFNNGLGNTGASNRGQGNTGASNQGSGNTGCGQAGHGQVGVNC